MWPSISYARTGIWLSGDDDRSMIVGSISGKSTLRRTWRTSGRLVAGSRMTTGGWRFGVLSTGAGASGSVEGLADHDREHRLAGEPRQLPGGHLLDVRAPDEVRHHLRGRLGPGPRRPVVDAAAEVLEARCVRPWRCSPAAASCSRARRAGPRRSSPSPVMPLPFSATSVTLFGGGAFCCFFASLRWSATAVAFSAASTSGVLNSCTARWISVSEPSSSCAPLKPWKSLSSSIRLWKRWPGGRW